MGDCVLQKEGDTCDYCQKGKMERLPKCGSRLQGRPKGLKIKEITDLQCNNCGHVHLQEQNDEYSKLPESPK